MTVLKFFMLLSLVAWIGGLIFFAFVLAPAAFAVAPSRQLAGAIVGRCLAALHWIGIISGVVFAATSMTYSALTVGRAEALAPRHLAVYLMLLLTLASQFAISPRMHQLRADMVDMDRISQDDARRVEFNRLHIWSTRFEGGVFVLGLIALLLTARRLGSP
jgi:uncharacterized membrane protein